MTLWKAVLSAAICSATSSSVGGGSVGSRKSSQLQKRQPLPSKWAPKLWRQAHAGLTAVSGDMAQLDKHVMDQAPGIVGAGHHIVAEITADRAPAVRPRRGRKDQQRRGT